MKTLLMIFLVCISNHAYSLSEDYHCDVRQYDLDITLTQDRSTSMWFRDRYDVLAMGYAGSVEKKGDKTIFHFYPGQFSPIDLTFKTQDTIDLPEKILGQIYISGPFFSLRDDLTCFRQ
jgi:hypothetical protein